MEYLFSVKDKVAVVTGAGEALDSCMPGLFCSLAPRW